MRGLEAQLAPPTSRGHAPVGDDPGSLAAVPGRLEMLYENLDVLPWWLVLLILIVAFMGVLEVAFRATRLRHAPNLEDEDRADDNVGPEEAFDRESRRAGRRLHRKRSHAALLLGSLLAMLGLLLAFGFGIAEARFTTRKQLVLDEANAIQTTYLRTDLLPSAHAERSRQLLRRYVADRVEVSDIESLPDLLAGSSRTQRELWDEAMASAAEVPESRYIPLYIGSLNQVLDLHEARITQATYYRLPAPALTSLFVVAVLAFGVLGHLFGLTRVRSFWPALATAAAVATIIVLIVELDRPWNRLFPVSQQSLADVQRAIAR